VTKGGINAKQVIITIISCVVPSHFAFIQHSREATFHQLIFGHTFFFPTHCAVLRSSSAEHNLPDSPFASPTKSAAAFAHDPFTPTESEIASPGRNAASFAGINNGGLTSHFRPSALDIPSPKPYFFPAMSRYVM
jgi:hypothetical protein